MDEVTGSFIKSSSWGKQVESFRKFMMFSMKNYLLLMNVYIEQNIMVTICWNKKKDFFSKLTGSLPDDEDTEPKRKQKNWLVKLVGIQQHFVMNQSLLFLLMCLKITRSVVENINLFQNVSYLYLPRLGTLDFVFEKLLQRIYKTQILFWRILLEVGSLDVRVLVTFRFREAKWKVIIEFYANSFFLLGIPNALTCADTKIEDTVSLDELFKTTDNAETEKVFGGRIRVHTNSNLLVFCSFQRKEKFLVLKFLITWKRPNQKNKIQ